MYFDPTMTLEEYEDFKLRDEINIGYDVEDDDLPEDIEDDYTASYVEVDASEMFGEPVIGYSLY